MGESTSGAARSTGTAVQTGPSEIWRSLFSAPIILNSVPVGAFDTGPFDTGPFDLASHLPPPALVAPAAETTGIGTTGIAPASVAPASVVPFPAAQDLRTTWPIEPNLRERGPAYAVMRQCLLLQGRAAPVGRIARVFGRSPLHPDARSWYRGALGEIVVANVLSQLGPEWTVLHAVPVGSGSTDIDHVILGPGGIFTINTKNHSGKKIWIGGSTFLVNGYKQDHMRNSFREAERASRLLSAVTARPVTVTPVIVVVNPASIITGRRRPRVTVLSSNTLKRWLERRPRVLSDRAVAHFSMFAEERSTWQTQPILFEDTNQHVERFERLRADVDAARRRASLWLMALGAAGVLVAPLVVMAVFTLLGSVGLPGN